MILYELLTGRVPFQGDTEEAIRFNVASQEPVRPRSIATVSRRTSKAIVMKCLEKKPEDRFASAKDLVDDLSRYLEGRPVRARSLGTIQRVAYWVKRNPRQAVLGSLSLCIIGSALAVAESPNGERVSKAIGRPIIGVKCCLQPTICMSMWPKSSSAEVQSAMTSYWISYSSPWIFTVSMLFKVDMMSTADID